MLKLKVFYYDIFLNGQKYKIYSSKYINVLNITNFLNYQSQRPILEHNGQIYNEFLRYEKVSHVFIKNKDHLEIITIVGGG